MVDGCLSPKTKKLEGVGQMIWILILNWQNLHSNSQSIGGLSNGVSFIDARKRRSKTHGTRFEKHGLPKPDVEHQEVEDFSVKSVIVPCAHWRLRRGLRAWKSRETRSIALKIRSLPPLKIGYWWRDFLKGTRRRSQGRPIKGVLSEGYPWVSLDVVSRRHNEWQPRILLYAYTTHAMGAMRVLCLKFRRNRIFSSTNVNLVPLDITSRALRGGSSLSTCDYWSSVFIFSKVEKPMVQLRPCRYDPICTANLCLRTKKSKSPTSSSARFSIAQLLSMGTKSTSSRISRSFLISPAL